MIFAGIFFSMIFRKILSVIMVGVSLGLCRRGPERTILQTRTRINHREGVVPVMAWFIGIDEAGYGPNLGPFVMTAVVCWAPDAAVDLWQILRAALRRSGGPRD